VSTTRSRETSTRRSAPDRGRYVALLRAVNVGGKGVVKKDALRAAFARAGATNVSTFIASGNVLFDAPPDRVESVVAGARKRLKPVLGAEPVVMVRSAKEMAALMRRGPFAGVDVPKILKRYILFLADPPARRFQLPLTQPKEALDIVHVAARDCWVVSRRKPSGMYGFPGIFVEAALGVPGTARSWSTVMKLAELLSGRLKAAPTTEAKGGPYRAAAAAATSAAWSSTLTLSHRFATLPSPSIRYVVRTMPMYLRP